MPTTPEPAFMRYRRTRCVFCEKPYRADVQEQPLRQQLSPCCDVGLRTKRWAHWGDKPIWRVERATIEAGMER